MLVLHEHHVRFLFFDVVLLDHEMRLQLLVLSLQVLVLFHEPHVFVPQLWDVALQALGGRSVLRLQVQVALMLPELLSRHCLVAFAAGNLYVGTYESQVVVEVTHGRIDLVAVFA